MTVILGKKTHSAVFFGAYPDAPAVVGEQAFHLGRLFLGKTCGTLNAGGDFA